MGRQRLLALLLAGAAALQMSVSNAHAQRREPGRVSATPETARQTFVERIDVRVVNLEAVVVDKDGNRVSGLQPEDFLLSVDGERVPIGYFSEVHGGVAVHDDSASVETAKPAQPAGVSGGQPVGTSYLLFIDSYFTTQAARRNQILDEIEEGLARLGPEDRMAIVAFGGRKLEVLSSWSQSQYELARAFERARALPARGFSTEAESRYVDRQSAQEAAVLEAAAAQDAAFADGGDDGTRAPTAMVRPDGLPADVCDSIRRLEGKVRREVMAVTAALRSFAKPPGRKVMVALSGGWPQSTKEYLVGGGVFSASECKSEGPKIYRPVYDTANQLGYTVYPVEVPISNTDAINAADASGIAGLEGSTRFARRYEEQATLLQMAAETGGEAMLGGASLSAFERVVADTRSYYWLGFVPDWKGNDKDHDIKLTVSSPGLEVRSRKGFLDFSRQTEISYVTESALLFGELPGSIRLGLKLGPLPEKGRGRLEVPVELQIPLDEIAMLPVGDHYVAELELRIAVLDAEGNRNEMAAIPVVLEGAVAPPPGAHAIYETAIKLRREAHDVVFSLYDPLTDTVMAATASIASPSRN